MYQNALHSAFWYIRFGTYVSHAWKPNTSTIQRPDKTMQELIISHDWPVAEPLWLSQLPTQYY